MLNVHHGSVLEALGPYGRGLLLELDCHGLLNERHGEAWPLVEYLRVQLSGAVAPLLMLLDVLRLRMLQRPVRCPAFRLALRVRCVRCVRSLGASTAIY